MVPWLLGAVGLRDCTACVGHDGARSLWEELLAGGSLAAVAFSYLSKEFSPRTHLSDTLSPCRVSTHPPSSPPPPARLEGNNATSRLGCSFSLGLHLLPFLPWSLQGPMLCPFKSLPILL